MSRHIAIVFAAVAAATILVTGAGAGSTSAPGQLAPVNLTPPFISGTTQVGSSLTAAVGRWDGKSLKYAYQWLRCDSGGASCSAIPGATSSTASLSSADLSATLRVLVTATNRNGSAASTSAATAAVASASVQPPPPPPPPPPAPTVTSPSTTSPPTISGTPQQSQTLSASAGSWSGTTPISYSYQWQRCASAGASCAPVVGATTANYLLAAADVGSTLRVSVTASNAVGSAAASSAATAVIAGTPSTSSPSPSGFYYAEHFDNSFNSSIFGVVAQSPSSFSWMQGALNQAGRITDCASTTSPCSGSGSDYGQYNTVWAPAQYAHAGYIPGSAVDTRYGNGKEEDTWYRFRMHFPSTFKATPGTQNSVFEFHVDEKTVADAKAAGQPNAYSINMAIASDGSGCSGTPALCTSPGTNPRLYLQVPGGPVALPASESSKRYYMPSNSLLLDHWYDIVLHIFWSPVNGHVEWWVDGAKQADALTPTEYVRRDGTYSYGEYIQFNNYRYWATWPSSVDFDELVWGPTAPSVGFIR